MAICDLSDLDTAMCSHCRGLDVRDVVSEGVQARTKAQHNGTCPGCDQRINVNDDIFLVHHKWYCADCIGDS